MHKKKIYLGFVQWANLAFRRSAKAVGECSVCEVHFVIANMKYLGAQSGMGFWIIKAWRIQFSCILFVYNNPIPSVSIRRWNTTIGDEDQVFSSTY